MTAADDLLERARAGDPSAFTEIVRQYEVPVYRAALAALGSPADAEEAAQDAFVSAFRRLDTFRGESSLKTWLVAIAWRKALTRRRRLQFFRQHTASALRDRDANPIEQAVDTSERADASIVSQEFRHQLAALIRSLPPKLRDPLLLVASGDHSYEEAAAILRVPVGTAKWRVSEARRVLREKLRSLGYER
jgi:RNA polymerase sigma-70 factor (ECF subfamily)